jgi:hypothetical protein
MIKDKNWYLGLCVSRLANTIFDSVAFTLNMALTFKTVLLVNITFTDKQKLNIPLQMECFERRFAL